MMTQKKNEPFRIVVSGRCGRIIYEENGNSLELEWEMSSSSKYDLLLAPLSLKHWKGNPDVLIGVEQQLEILKALRLWLKRISYKTNIDLPEKMNLVDEECIRAGCENKRLEGIVYCLHHYNLTMLE